MNYLINVIWKIFSEILTLSHMSHTVINSNDRCLNHTMYVANETTQILEENKGDSQKDVSSKENITRFSDMKLYPPYQNSHF